MKRKVNKTGADRFTLAVAKVDPKENPARYYTLTSVKTGIPDGRSVIRSWIMPVDSLELPGRKKEPAFAKELIPANLLSRFMRHTDIMLRIKTEIYRNRERFLWIRQKPGDVICYGSGKKQVQPVFMWVTARWYRLLRREARW